jgi:hypothetical protein
VLHDNKNILIYVKNLFQQTTQKYENVTNSCWIKSWTYKCEGLCNSHICVTNYCCIMIFRHVMMCLWSKVVSKWDKIFNKICSFHSGEGFWCGQLVMSPYSLVGSYQCSRDILHWFSGWKWAKFGSGMLYRQWNGEGWITEYRSGQLKHRMRMRRWFLRLCQSRVWVCDV